MKQENEKKTRNLRLLLDVPEDDAIFGFSEYASVLTSAVVGTEPHFTIGIFGEWGTGKTTLLRKIESILKSKYPENVLPVFFDAWRYQREEHMLLPMLDTISEVLSQNQSNWKHLYKHVRKLTKTMATALSIKTQFVEINPKDAIETWESEGIARSDYYGWLSELQSALDESRIGNITKRVVIIIDDLDRCLPQKVIEVLESIKVMLDVSGFVFVIALDESVVENAIEGYYGKESNINGKDYIKKLVQVEFRLPPLRQSDVVNFTSLLQTRLEPFDNKSSTILAEVIPEVVGGNPREIKRFINGVLVATSIMKGAGISVPIPNQIAFMAMEYGWHGFITDLASDQNLLKKVKSYFKDSTSLPDKDKKAVGDILKIYQGLVSYLQKLPGSQLLELTENDFNELVYYTSMTREKKREEVLKDSIDEILKTLTPRERRVLQLRFGLEDGKSRTLAEVGKEFGLSRERIRQIEAKALRKLRHPSRSRKLKDYLPFESELDESSQDLMSGIFGLPLKE